MAIAKRDADMEMNLKRSHYLKKLSFISQKYDDLRIPNDFNNDVCRYALKKKFKRCTLSMITQAQRCTPASLLVDLLEIGQGK